MGQDKLYDLIIIGAGPAGITAGVYAARKGMEMLVLTGDIGGQTAWSGNIENYTGYQFVSGVELASKFDEHMKKYDIPVKEGEEATGLKKEGNTIIVATAGGQYRAKSVIIASGKRSRELEVPGEKEFRNKGITYCATCDGPLFAGKDVVIAGGGNSALDAALQLVKIARHVHIVDIAPELSGDAVMREKVSGSGNVTVHSGSRILSIGGDKFVNKVAVSGPGGEKELAAEGVFVEIGLIPNSGFAGMTEKNEDGEIKVDCHNRTNVPGVFAAGDVTDVPEKQIIVAAGEGAKAALGAFAYISRMKPGKDWNT